MNPEKYKYQDEIDLLAVGELLSQERDGLFKKFELDGEGWKLCAISLLENQALEKSIGEIVPRGIGVGAPLNISAQSSKLAVKSFDSSPPNSNWRKWALMAMAACVFVAIGLLIGVTIDSNSRTSFARPSNIENELNHRVAEIGDPDLVQQVNLAINSTGVNDFELVAFVGVENELRTRYYPIIKSAELERKMTMLEPASLAYSSVQELHRSGWRLNAQQQFVSFKMPDGNSEAIPVGMLNCRYVGQETF